MSNINVFFFKKHKFFSIVTLFFLVVLIIIFSWFKEGKIISNTSEEELSIYHSQKTAKNYSNFWYPPGIGHKAPFQLARFPTFLILGWFENIGMPAFLRQALLFGVLMVVGISSMYLLLKKCFGISSSIALIGSFFYLLNIYSMTQVWKRLLYHGIFAWAYLPLFLFLWIKWIEDKKIMWLFLFLFTSVLFSYAFSQPPFMITIWAPAGIFVLVKVWQSRLKVAELSSIFLRAISGLILWCLVNIWWLYPMLNLGSTFATETGQTWQGNLSSLHAVSKDFPIWEVLLLRQSWYLSSNNDFGSFYLNPIIILINLLPLLFVVLAIFKLKEFPYWKFLIALAFVGLFISKGTNFPLGYTFFRLLFSNFLFTTAFRNSYEKFGLVWLLAYTILFALGFSKFLLSLKLNKKYLYSGILLFLILLVLVFPFWSGSLFPQKHRLYVPQYYDEANNYLNQQSNDRLFHIPFLLELENLTYSWGFMGGDPSPALFNLESITVPKKPLYYQISLLLPKYLNNKQFPKILSLLGVGNVILHKDSVYPTVDLKEMTKNIESWVNIQNKKEIGELVIYSLNKKIIKPSVYGVSSLIPVQSSEEMLAIVISDKFDTKNTVFVIGNSPITLITSTQIPPQIIFNKLSNDHFLVEVRQAIAPFILILNNTFDNSWQLKIGDQPIDKHFIINGFANGWLVEKTGDYKADIRLKVWPWD